VVAYRAYIITLSADRARLNKPRFQAYPYSYSAVWLLTPIGCWWQTILSSYCHPDRRHFGHSSPTCARLVVLGLRSLVRLCSGSYLQLGLTTWKMKIH